MEMVSYLINSFCWITGFVTVLILALAGTDMISKKLGKKFKAFCRSNIFIQAWLNSDKDKTRPAENTEDTERVSCGLVLSESPVAGK